VSAPQAIVEALVEDEGWATLPDPQALADRAAGAALAEAALLAPGLTGPFEISVLFAGDAGVAELTGRFRGKPAPTNVLSWPAFALAPSAPGAAPPPPPAGPAGAPCFLGDVALAAQTVAREAAERGLALSDHAAHLVAHAVLHLLGYDHETDEDATTMESVERRALARIGIEDPYAADAA
jgi:probable rRNA maturation factor